LDIIGGTTRVRFPCRVWIRTIRQANRGTFFDFAKRTIDLLSDAALDDASGAADHMWSTE